jgi:hypothetical protein
MDLFITYDNSLSAGTCSNGNNITFSSNGAISIDMNNSDYALFQVFDDGYYNIPWHTITVSGENANTASLERIGDDTLFTCDNMKNVIVTGENNIETVTLAFTTDKENVLLKVENNNLVAYIDTNDDGKFDMLIATSEEQSEQITITATAGTGGSASGGGVYNENTDVTLTAKPNANYIFDGWYENNVKINGAGATYTFKATVNRNLEARFIYSDNSNSSGNSGSGYSPPPLVNNDTAPSNTSDDSTIAVSPDIDEPIEVDEDETPLPIQNNISANVSPTLAGILETENHIRYIYGYEDDTFKPNNPITRAEVAMMFFRLIKDTKKNNTINGVFTDVSGTSWYTQAVNYLAEINILKGYEDGTFKPNQNITRAEFSAIASRFDEMENGIENSFIDISRDFWAYENIMSAYSKGWIKGYPDNSFKPQNHITRAEAVAIINRMLDRKITEGILDDLKNLYKDLSVNHWAFKDIIMASMEP